MSQASLVMIPSGYKEDVVYSAIPTNGNGDLSFTRASNGTRINSAGLGEVCPWNLATYSEQFTNAIYTPKNGTFTDNFAVAPNGTTTAAKFEATDSDPYIYQSFNGTNQVYTATCYVKATGTAIGKNCSIRISSSAVFTVMTGEWQQLTITANINGNVNVGVEAPESATSGEIVYIWGFQINVGSTAKPYFPTTDRLNVPRLTYQNGGGGCPSLLLEKQSTNLVTYSEQFDDAIWTKYQGGTITANSVTSPDGTQNADTLTVASGQVYSGIYQSVSGSSDVYTISVFAKYNTKRWLFIFDASASAQGWFDIQNGVLGTIPSGHTGTIENFGNGWYRCTFKKNTAVTPAFFQIGLVDSDGFSTPTSNGSAYLWGAQLEASSYATSLINTTSSSATRVADACFKTGISSLIGQTQGTLFVDSVLTHSTTNNEYLIQVSESGSNRFFIYREGNSNKLGCFVLIGSTQIYTQLTSGAITGRVKAAFAYQSGSFAFYVNGTQVGTSAATFSTPPTMGRLDIDSNAGAENGYYNYNEAIIFPTRITNAELASLTTI